MKIKHFENIIEYSTKQVVGGNTGKDPMPVTHNRLLFKIIVLEGITYRSKKFCSITIYVNNGYLLLNSKCPVILIKGY